jgi:ribonuclease J
VGRSMEKNVRMAIGLGYLYITAEDLLSTSEMNNLPREQVVICCTGSQGEPTSVLARLAAEEHPQLQVIPGDTVVLSATPIPGNEEMVNHIVDDLFRLGADVIYHDLADVHVSGHGSREDHKLMLSLTRPRFFMPIHGELRHLHAHASLARQIGIPSESIFILENGSVLELTATSATVVEKLANQNVFVDGAGVGEIGPAVMREREVLARDGFVMAVLSVGLATGELTGKPELVSRGFVYLQESQELLDRAAERVWRELHGITHRKPQAMADRAREILSQFFYEETRRKPMIIAIPSHV